MASALMISIPITVGLLGRSWKAGSPPELAIQGGAQWIKANYIENALVMESGTTASQNTLYKMRFAPGLSNTWHQYATSLTWPHSIARLISEAYSFFGERWVPYEIPLYQQ